VRFLVDGDTVAEAVVEEVFLDAWRAMPPGSATEQGALVRLAVAAERRGLAAAAAGRDAVLALPQRERAVVLLRFVAGLDGPTVRAATGLTTAQLGTLQHRALARLSAGPRAAPVQNSGTASLAGASASPTGTSFAWLESWATNRRRVHASSS
jgi:DNA-directed RNA polymerase specialized sigma24 family protein